MTGEESLGRAGGKGMGRGRPWAPVQGAEGGGEKVERRLRLE